MHKLERYPKYKDSGVEWIGEIPEHWELKKIKVILQERKEANNPIKTKNILSLCMYRGVIPYSEKGNAGNKAKNDLTAYKLAYPGDIVLNSMNVIAGSVGLSKFFGAVSPVYYMLNPRNSFDKVEFFNNVFQSEGFQKSLAGLGNGILIKKSESTGKLNTIRMRIPMDKLNNVLIPYPSPEEQTKIANYLDQKTAQIDRAITLKEQLIEKLKERRQILINDAVTKGLDKTVKMKDSGVEWIGEIPEHWEVKRAKYIFKEINIRSETGEEELLSLSKYKGVVPKSSLEERAGMAESLIGYKKVYKDTLVINKMQAVNGLIGVAKIEGITSPDYSVYDVLSNDFDIDYYGELLKQKLFLAEFKKVVTGVMEGFIRLYTDDLFQIYMHVPPIQEQKEIVNYIKRTSARIDKSISLQQQQIEKLKEYKATLIDSVVTGKVRVS